VNSKLFATYFLFLFFTLSSLQSQNLDYFEYIYVNANSGQSSGGHSAIKFGNWVYHFQYYPDKIFHLVRDPWFDFRYTYNVMENRSLHLTKVQPSKDVVKKLERGFNTYYIVQEKHLNNVELIQREIEFQSLFRNHKLKNFKIKSLGYFSKYNSKSNAYNKIQDKINSKLGTNFLVRSQNQINQEFWNIQATDLKLNIPSLDSKSFYSLPELMHEKYEKAVQQLSLITILENKLSLKKTSLIKFPKNKDLQPKEIELNLYREFLNQLEDRLIYQLENKDGNPNWAEDCLITLASYLVVFESIEQKTFIFLDTLPNNEEQVNWQIENDALKLAIDTFPLFSNLRKEIFEDTKEIYMQNFIELQDSANRWIEIQKATSLERAIRNTPNRTLPQKYSEAWISLPFINSIELPKNSIDELQRKLESYSSRLNEIYPYHLIFQNCTSEIFVKISEIYSQDTKKIQSDLGKDINPNTSLAFIPFYSSYDVRKNYKSKSISEILSYRRKYVSKRLEKENKWWIEYQEDFTPSSTIYKRNENDHYFLFFTDDTFYLRPIYGIFNLGTGLTQTLFGIPMVVLDKGDNLKKGLDGIFFSMPELIFFNIRKGSFYRTTISELDENFPDYTMEPIHE